MGVYINMEMPTEGQQKSFLLHFNDDGTANIVALGYPQKPYEVVPVPPHGRLIDADADPNEYVTVWDCDCSEFGRQTVMAVDDLAYLPTIIPADPAEDGEI